MPITGCDAITGLHPPRRREERCQHGTALLIRDHTYTMVTMRAAIIWPIGHGWPWVIGKPDIIRITPMVIRISKKIRI